MTSKPPFVAYDHLGTLLVYAPGKALRTACDGVVQQPRAVTVLADYPVKRWVEMVLQDIEIRCTVVPASVTKILRGLLADPNLEYNLDHFSKESIMATAKKTAAAAETTDAKAKNAAKAPAAKKTAAKAETAAPAAKKTAAKAETAAPAKQPTAKAAKAAEAAGEGRKGRPSPHALDAKIGKGKEDFKAHVREGTHRYSRNEFLVKNAGKTVGDVLGQEFEPGYPIVSKHISAALEAGYITLSK